MSRSLLLGLEARQHAGLVSGFKRLQKRFTRSREESEGAFGVDKDVSRSISRPLGSC